MISYMGFPNITGTILGVPRIRTIVYWRLYWGPLIWESTIRRGVSQNTGSVGNSVEYQDRKELPRAGRDDSGDVG